MRTSAATAIVFDVDGTLYRQREVRVRMAAKLVGHILAHPRDGARLQRVLRCYRKAHEQLRSEGQPLDEGAQLARAAAEACVAREDAAQMIRHWFESVPLAYVARAGAPERVALFAALRQRGMKVGVLSDYPARDKLSALGLTTHVDCIRSTQDADIAVLKPDPKGLQVIIAELDTQPDTVIYVGDRDDVDRPTAERIGCRFVNVHHTPFLAGRGEKTLHAMLHLLVGTPMPSPVASAIEHTTA